jgi:tellurite resistance protein
MPNRKTLSRSNMPPAEIVAAYRDDREDELLDAVLTAAALVARADGRVQPVECGQLLDFLDRNEFLSIFTRADILSIFECCIDELREPGGPAGAVARLTCHAERLPARLIIDAGEEVAAADCRLDPREQRVLQLIRTILCASPSPSAPGSDCPAAAR